MNIAVLGQPDGWYVAKLLRAAQLRGHQAFAIDFRTITSYVNGVETQQTSNNVDLLSCDAVIVRTMPVGSLEQVVYRMDSLLRLQDQGVLVLNSPKAIEASVDKFLTTSFLASAHLPTPRTIVCEGSDEAMNGFLSLNSDVVVKPIFGSEGRGIIRITDQDIAYRTFKTLERIQAVLYLQEYIPHSGFDVRVLVLNDQIVGAIRREHPTDFRTNISRQAVASPHQLTEKEAFLALHAAEAVDTCFAGVDLLYHPDGRCFVIEVNAVPGWRAVQNVTGIAVAEKVIEFLESR